MKSPHEKGWIVQHWIRISAPLWIIAIVVFPTTAIRAEITADQVRRAISRGTGYLIRTQREDGSWQGMESLGFPGGVTSLAVVALIYSGIPDSHPAIDKALQYLRQIDPQKTYTVALQTMAFGGSSEDFRSPYILLLENVKILLILQNRNV